MNVSLQQVRRSWSSAVVWWAVFLSPTAYFLLLVLASQLEVPRLPDVFVWLLFVIPLAALVICESLAWSHMSTLAGKIGGLAMTLLGMLLQCAVLLVILRAILVTRIAYVQ